jgi:1-acyl-sn-glycerol-3-phosphate acyltransferase
VPVAVVGAEEIYPLLGNVEPLARLFGVPFFPITPAFPWLGPLGAVPLPTRWSITFCPPISTAEYGPEAADDPLTVFMLSEQVRGVLQETIDARLAQRTSIF